MAIFIDIIFVAYTFALLLFCGFYPRIPAIIKNATLTVLGKAVCEHEDKPADKPFRK